MATGSGDQLHPADDALPYAHQPVAEAGRIGGAWNDLGADRLLYRLKTAMVASLLFTTTCFDSAAPCGGWQVTKYVPGLSETRIVSRKASYAAASWTLPGTCS